MKKLITYTAICIFFFSSCKKAIPLELIVSNNSATQYIKVPTNFKWETASNLNITVNINDTRSPNSIFMVSIYNGDPSQGGVNIAKGAASNLFAFKSKLNISKQVPFIYIVKTSPDDVEIIQKIAVASTDIIANFNN